MTLKDLPIGKTATIRSVGGEGALRQHFLDMGLIPKGDVTMVKYAPMGDPMELRIHSYELTLRLADADKIEIENVRGRRRKRGETSKEKTISHSIPHPGLGEGGKFHFKETENPFRTVKCLPLHWQETRTAERQALFNQLTGSSQHVGNSQVLLWTERTDRSVEKQYPGNRSSGNLFHVSVFQRRNRNKEFVLNEHPRGIINIVDATNIERNLYLTMQLMELDIPMVLALNMMDEVREKRRFDHY